MADPIRTRVVDQERALLAVALASTDGAALFDEFEPEDYLAEDVTTAWSACKAAVRRGSAPSTLLLATAGLSERDHERLTALVHGARGVGPFTVRAEYGRARATYDLAITLGVVQGMLAQPDANPTAVALDAEAAMRACTNSLGASSRQTLVECGRDLVSAIRDESWRIRLPQSIDDQTGGLREGQVLVILGRSGHGKSCVALTAAVDTAAAGQRVLFVSREMPAPHLAARLGAMLLDRAPHELRSDLKYDDDAAHEFYERLASVEGRLVIDDQSRDVRDVEAEVRRARLAGEPYHLVVLDFIQQFDGPGEVKHEILEAVAYRMKDMAMRERCAVIAPAQVNRTGSREAEVPGMDAIRGSSGIENAADTIVGISLGQRNSMSGDSPIEARVSKARNGRPGPVDGGLVLRSSLRVDCGRTSFA